MVLLQHYPMYRQSDAACEGPDSAPPEEKYKIMKPKYDCLSQEATSKVFNFTLRRFAFILMVAAAGNMQLYTIAFVLVLLQFLIYLVHVFYRSES